MNKEIIYQSGEVYKKRFVQKMHIPCRVVTSEKKQLFGNSEQLKKTQLSQILRQLLKIDRVL